MKKSERLFVELLTKFESSEITDENIQECIKMIESYTKKVLKDAHKTGTFKNPNFGDYWKQTFK